MSIESKIQQNIPLAPLTTFKIGGPAEYFIEVKTKDELIESIVWSKKNKKEFFILAGGSNVIINDNGIKGLVIKMVNDNMYLRCDRVECGAGADLMRAVRLTAVMGLSGLEWAIGIPGTIGGAIRGNAGSFGYSIDNFVETIEVFNVKKQKFLLFSRRDCKFGYKDSIFKNNKNLLIWNIILKLEKEKKAVINQLVDNYTIRRQRTQPKLPSAGCVFKNFFINNLKNSNSNLAQQAINEGVVAGDKVSSGWIINRLGLQGKTMGGAKISLEHANFIVNTGRATAEEVIMLISYIKQQVRTHFRVQLQEEVEYFGF